MFFVSITCFNMPMDFEVRYYIVTIVFLLTRLHYFVGGKPQVPCYFIFGDSLVDTGNNNYLPTLARADYPPHGIDFSSGPTGRFSNGRVITDITAEILGFNNYIQAYATSGDSNLLLGVNYASAAAGIRNETGQHLGDRIAFDAQLENHRTTLERLTNILGNNNSGTINYLTKCLYYVGFGSNDYLNNYFIPEAYTTSDMYTPEQFAEVLIEQYHQQILTLCKYGARKIALYNVGPVGCTPSEIARYHANESSCIESINVAVQLFNNRLKSLVKEINEDSSLNGAHFVYVNIYDITMDAITDPSAYGFTVTETACCGVGRNKGGLTCIPFEIPCQNRSDHIFWDAYHPTEHSNEVIAARSYKAVRVSDAYPIDIHRLVQL